MAIADGDRVIEEHRFTPSLARNIYSHTKSYAVTGIGVAVEEGLLSLDDRLVDAFPSMCRTTPSRSSGGSRCVIC